MRGEHAKGNVARSKCPALVSAFKVNVQAAESEFERCVDKLSDLETAANEPFLLALKTISKDGKADLPVFARMIEHLWTTEWNVDELKSVALKVLASHSQKMHSASDPIPKDFIVRTPELAVELLFSLTTRGL